MVDGGQISDLMFDLAAVYEMAGHALTTVKELSAFLFHQAESLRLTAASGPGSDPTALLAAMHAYAQGSKNYLHNVIEGSASKRRVS